MGHVDIDEPNATKLTRDECKSRLLELMRQGYNPNYLRPQLDMIELPADFPHDSPNVTGAYD